MDELDKEKNYILMDCLQILAEKMPEVLDFTKDLSSLEPSTKVLSYHISCAVW